MSAGRRTDLGSGDESGAQRVVAHGGDGRLVSIEADVALAVEQTEEPHGAVLVAHGQVGAIWRRAKEGHLMFLASEDQHLHREERNKYEQEVFTVHRCTFGSGK